MELFVEIILGLLNWKWNNAQYTVGEGTTNSRRKSINLYNKYSKLQS